VLHTELKGKVTALKAVFPSIHVSYFLKGETSRLDHVEPLSRSCCETNETLWDESFFL